MEDFLIKIASLCLSAMGGAALISSLFTLMGKPDILMQFERKHFTEKFAKVLARIEAIFGILFSFLVFFLASTMLFENSERMSLAFKLFGCLALVYLVVYIFFWFKKSRR